MFTTLMLFLCAYVFFRFITVLTTRYMRKRNYPNLTTISYLKWPWFFFLGEALAALFYVLVWNEWTGRISMILFSVLLIFLWMISVTDLICLIIPNTINYTGLVIMLGIHLFINPDNIFEYILSALVGAGVLWGTALFYPGGMGGGDIKLMAVIGMAIGWKCSLLTLFISSLIGVIFGVLLLMRRRITRNQPLPFGPFLAFGAIVSVLWGRTLFESYTMFFLQEGL